MMESYVTSSYILGWRKRVMSKPGLEKIVVRRLIPEDRTTLYRWLQDPAIRSAIEDETIDFSRMSETMCLFEKADPFSDGAIGLIVEVLGRPIGLIHFACLNWINRNAEVIVVVGPQEFRSSLGAAIVVEKIGHIAFRILNLHKIYAFVYATNKSAISLFSKLMKEEACLHNYIQSTNGYGDLHLFGLLACEYFSTMEKLAGHH